MGRVLLMYNVWKLLSFKDFDKVVVLWEKNLHVIIKMLLAAHRDKKHSYFILIICKLERNQIFARVEEQGKWNLDCKVKIDWVQKKSLISCYQSEMDLWRMWVLGSHLQNKEILRVLVEDRRTHTDLILKVKYSYIILYYIQIYNNK